MLEDSPLLQIIISLIILFLMGYFAYNIYLIEFEKMLKNSSNDIRKEIDIINGIFDYKTYTESKFVTDNKSKKEYMDINPSINQEGGAEYSYNFWLYVDKNKLSMSGDDNKDIVLFFKGEKNLYYSANNYNCSSKRQGNNNVPNILIKNPLVRLRNNGSSLIVEFNNIYNADSYQHRSDYKNCNDVNGEQWMEKNKNMLGIYNLDFNNKWFMVTIVMKEVSDSNNILIKNRASCKIFVNGLNVLDKKAETRYNNETYSATFKNNKSPFYIRPKFNKVKKDNNIFFDHDNIIDENVLKIADLKYFNYSLDEKKILELLGNGFRKSAARINVKSDELNYIMVSESEMDKNEIKEI